MITNQTDPGVLRLQLARMERERDEARDRLGAMEQRYATLVRQNDELREQLQQATEWMSLYGTKV